MSIGSVVSKAAVITLALLFVINPLLSFLGVIHSGVYYIDYWEGGNQYIIGDNYEIYDEEKANELGIVAEDFPNAWSETKHIFQTLLDSMTFLSYGVGLPYKYGTYTEEGTIVQGKDIKWIPNLAVVAEDLAMGDERIEDLLQNCDIPLYEICDVEEWDYLSNITKLLLIYNHENYILNPDSPGYGDSDDNWVERVWDTISNAIGGFFEIITS